MVKTEGRVVVSRDWGRGRGSCCFMGTDSVLQDEGLELGRTTMRMYLTLLIPCALKNG